MKIEQAKEIAGKAIGQLAESLERGHSEELKRYLAAMAKFPKYSLHNVCLILAQRPDTARVAGYQETRLPVVVPAVEAQAGHRLGVAEQRGGPLESHFATCWFPPFSVVPT